MSDKSLEMAQDLVGHGLAGGAWPLAACGPCALHGARSKNVDDIVVTFQRFQTSFLGYVWWGVNYWNCIVGGAQGEPLAD